MKKKCWLYTSVVLIVFSITSCKKWLEVQPEDKFTVDQIYSTPEGIQEVVTGFYVKLGSNKLYGSNLTLTTLDVFAQRYLTNVYNHSWANYGSLSYTQDNVKESLSDIWTEMYSTIANINDFIKVLPSVNGVIPDSQKNRYIGEAIGLRAFIHFDLLRMFGPTYDESTKDIESIPYYTQLSLHIQPFLSTKSVIDSIFADIGKAEILLKTNDPILAEKGTDNFNNNRFNYYALLTLKARLYQWIGDKENALSTAKMVIGAQDKFPWITHSAITANGSNPDRKFFTETIFNVFNSKLYDVQLNSFDPNLLETKILSTGIADYIDKLYEENQADYRYVYSWPSASTGVGYRTFVKFQDIADVDASSRFMMPLMRISELYYIAAESTSDETEALKYLNTVRQHRSLSNDILEYSVFKDELTKEYIKEFYGEGQLWYYYKRNKITSVTSMNTSDNKKTISLSQYQFDIPEIEMEGR